MESYSPIISVIMPVFNTGELLHTTIASIRSQTFSDFELLLIDDGSTDGSGGICDEYARHDPRIVVLHRKNGGICNARNAGLIKARGEYIVFCDHDDIYDSRLIEVCVGQIETYSPDLIKYGVQIDTEQISKQRCMKFEVIDEWSLRSSLFEYARNGVFCNVWDAVFRKSILIDNKIIFDEFYTKGREDISFNLKALPYIKCMVTVDEVLYHHYVRERVSTSAKLYSEVIDGIIRNTSDMRHSISIMKIDTKSASGGYNYYFSRQCLIPLMLYMVKMQIKSSFFSDKLHELHSGNAHLLSSNRGVLAAINVDAFLLFFFRVQNYHALYILACSHKRIKTVYCHLRKYLFLNNNKIK